MVIELITEQNSEKGRRHYVAEKDCSQKKREGKCRPKKKMHRATGNETKSLGLEVEIVSEIH